jgi:hypothetical protein
VLRHAQPQSHARDLRPPDPTLPTPPAPTASHRMRSISDPGAMRKHRPYQDHRSWRTAYPCPSMTDRPPRAREPL